MGQTEIPYHYLLDANADQTLAMSTIQGLLGMVYWGRIYGSRVITTKDTVPLQMQHLLQHALNKVDNDLKVTEGETQQVVKDAGAKVKKVMRDATALKKKKEDKKEKKKEAGSEEVDSDA